MAFPDAPVGLLCSEKLSRCFFDATHLGFVACENTEIIFLADALEKLLDFFWRNLRVWTDDEQHAAFAHAVGDIFELGQWKDVVVTGLARRLEHAGESMANQVVHLILGCVVRKTLEQLGEILLAIEIVSLFRRAVDIPRRFFQLLEGGEELRRLAER